MALGGGSFLVQNKVLPGTYINFVSKASASNIFSDRGVGALVIENQWYDGAVRTITKDDFYNNAIELFGEDATSGSDLMISLRDFFKGAKELVFASAFSTTGAKRASNDFAKAKKFGVIGNSIKIVITANVDDPDLYDVYTYLSDSCVDEQKGVHSADELQDNALVSFVKTATLAITAGTPLEGATSGAVTGDTFYDALKKLEQCNFNAIGAITDVDEYHDLLIEWTKRMRDEVGKKFQCVVYRYTNKPDYEGCVVQDFFVQSDGDGYEVAWLTGQIAGCAVNASLTNKVYDGEFSIDSGYLNKTQAQLEQTIQDGKLALHRVGSEIRVLLDINSLTTVTETKGEIFKDNQTIRVCDQIANDIATIFNTRYLGLVPNDKAGRISLWNDIVKHHQTLQTIRAIEDFDEADITVEQGETKNSVVVNEAVTPINAMAKLYMTVTVE